MTASISESRKPARNSNIEFLRILAMFLIVAHHYAYHGAFSFTDNHITLAQAWWCILLPGGGIGVDVFVLISGYYLIQNTGLRLSVRKISKLWGQVFLCSVLLYILSMILHREKTYQYGIFSALFPLSTSQWWFASNYFILYLLHPHLNRLLRSLEKAQYQKLLLVLLAIWVVIPNLSGMRFLINEIAFFVVLYAIAGYIRLYGLSPSVKGRSWLWMGLAVFLVECLLLILLTECGKQSDLSRIAATPIINKQSVFSVFSAVCLLMGFSALPARHSRAVNLISSATFGVYLLHDSNLLRPILWQELFVNLSIQYTAKLIPFSLLVSACVFLCCALVDLARQYLLERPFLRLMDAHSGKITKALQAAGARARKCLFGREP